MPEDYPSKAIQMNVVPAQPGFNLIFQVRDHGEVIDLCREPVIAWHIETQTFERYDGCRHTVSTTMPITVRTACPSDWEVWAVEFPDGRCDLPNDRILQSAAELLKFWQEVSQVVARNNLTNN